MKYERTHFVQQIIAKCNSFLMGHSSWPTLLKHLHDILAKMEKLPDDPPAKKD